MKKNLTKLMALIMALALVLAFAACSNDPEPATSTEPSTDAVSQTETDTAPVDNTDPSGEPESTDPQVDPQGMPEGKDAIVAYYAAAANKVKSEGKSLTGTGKISVNDVSVAGGGADSIIGKIVDMIVPKDADQYDSVNNYPIGEWRSKNAYACKLTGADVSSATISQSGSNYVIKIALPDEPNPSSDLNSKHGRAFDVLDTDGINDTIATVEKFVKEVKVDLTYSGSTIEATVDSASGRVIKATYNMNVKVAGSGKLFGSTKNFSANVNYAQIFTQINY